MFSLDIPGFANLRLKHLVLDFNGTIAIDGRLDSGVDGLIRKLSGDLDIHVLTADTGGRCRRHLKGLPLKIHILDRKPEDTAKKEYIDSLGPERCASIQVGQTRSMPVRWRSTPLLVGLSTHRHSRCSL